MSSSKKETSASKKALFSSSSVSFAMRDDALTPSSHSSRHRNQTISTEKRESTRSAHSHVISTPNSNSSIRMETPDGKSLMLLPPSQTIRESLNALAISTSSQLENVWDELGCNPEERADQLTDLLSGFRRLCEEKITSEKLVVKNYYQTIASYKEEIKTTSFALKVDLDESLLQGDSTQTLQDEVITLELKLENLRSVAEVAKKTLCQYRDRLLNTYEALGLELEDSWRDVASDMTQSRQEEFQNKVKEMDEIVATRTSAVVRLVKDCQELIESLKCSAEERKLDYMIMNSLVKREDGSTIMKSNIRTDDCTGISSKSLDELTNRVSELNGEKRRRKSLLAQMGADIGELWEKLHVSMKDQKAFAESINGLGMDTLEKGEAELSRLFQLKSEMMGKLVTEAREKIHQLWDDVNANAKQRDVFKGMIIEDESNFTDELLTEHEEYIQVLLDRLEQMRPILMIIEKRQAIVEERMEYEELQKDPERLQQRGSTLTKQLMKEEKMSRRIKKDLPRYTELLQKKLKEWDENNGEPFLYKGQECVDVINEQEDEWRQYKDKQMQMKQLKRQEKADKKSSKTYKPLPGKKRTISSAPLSDGTNRLRAESRGRGKAHPSGNMGKRPISRSTRPVSRP